jgi:hypothetical protein
MEQLTLLLEVSPASHTAAQANASEKMTSAIFGQRCYEQYEKFPRVTSWAKMFAASLIGTEGWYSRRCALTWKILGIKSRPVLYLLAGSVRPTEGSAFGLLPTPTAMQDAADPAKVDARNAKQIAMGNPKFILGLTQMAMRGMLPTPNAAEAYNGAKTYNPKSQMGRSLSALAGSAMLPTPNSYDWNTARSPEALEKAQKRHKAKGVILQTSLRQMAGQGSQLNPQFVAEMMGFPTDWTELPFQSGEQNQ